MQLEIKHICAYAQHQVQVQYEGIINGGEIKQYKKENEHLLKNASTIFEYKEPEPIIGTKTGLIKRIEINKSGWFKCFIGTKYVGLKTFYNGVGFKLLLRPLSSLTKEITHNGETFVPSIKIHEDELFQSMVAMFSVGQFPLEDLNYGIVEKLLEWNFDLYNLIDNGLGINIETIDKQ